MTKAQETYWRRMVCRLTIGDELVFDSRESAFGVKALGKDYGMKMSARQKKACRQVRIVLRRIA